jgi:hypothetical protein
MHSGSPVQPGPGSSAFELQAARVNKAKRVRSRIRPIIRPRDSLIADLIVKVIFNSAGAEVGTRPG